MIFLAELGFIARGGGEGQIQTDGERARETAVVWNLRTDMRHFHSKISDAFPPIRHCFVKKRKHAVTEQSQEALVRKGAQNGTYKTARVIPLDEMKYL